MQEQLEILRDEKTGLPMHNHLIREVVNGMIVNKADNIIPCDCKYRAYDYPLKAFQAQSETLESKE